MEYELLFFFLSHPGMVFTREQLLDRIWGYDFAGNSRTVDTHVKTLRQKLGSCLLYTSAYSVTEKTEETERFRLTVMYGGRQVQGEGGVKERLALADALSLQIRREL